MSPSLFLFRQTKQIAGVKSRVHYTADRKTWQQLLCRFRFERLQQIRIGPILRESAAFVRYEHIKEQKRSAKVGKKELSGASKAAESSFFAARRQGISSSDADFNP
jgi:hypothetical protein